MVIPGFKRRRPAWEFTPGLPIWRIHPPVNNRIIGEVRDVEAKQTTFFALDAESGACLWRDRTFHDPWWVAIERVAGDRLVLHGFVAPDSPLLRGATVIDIPGGAVVWSNMEWNGEQSELVAAGVNLSDTWTGESTVFPISHDPHAPDMIRQSFMASWPADAIVAGIEVAGYGRRTVAAAHIASVRDSAASLALHLKIHDADSGNVVYEDTLIAAAKGIAPDAFFVQEGTLYYIRERKTLCAVEL